MRTSPSNARHRSVATSTLLAAAATAWLLGCSADVGVTPSTLPAPSLASDVAPASCPAATGASTLVLDPNVSRITIGAAGSEPENRIEVFGTTTGSPATENVHLALLPLTLNCPVFSVTTATWGTGGDFSAILDIGELTAFRVVGIATAGPATDVGCGVSGTCIEVGAGSGAPLGVSNSLAVRLQ